LFLLIFIPQIALILILLLATWATYAKSTITLTNRRLMFRTGLLAKRTGDAELPDLAR
jgi:hypothetical protein